MSVAEDRVEGSLPDSEDDAPDSSVRPIGVIEITRAPASSIVRVVDLAIRVTGAIMENATSAYITLSVPGGETLFEGFTDDDGSLEVSITIPTSVTNVHAFVEAGTKSRHATFALRAAGEGATDLVFA